MVPTLSGPTPSTPGPADAPAGRHAFVAASAGALAALVLAALVLAGAPSPLAAQQGAQQEVEVEVIHVSGSVYMLEGRGGNIGVSAGPDGVVLVDDQFARLAPQIRAAVDTLAERGLRFVLNTHWHGDHTGGNAAFGRDAPIVAHHNVRERLATAQVIRGDTIAASPDSALPILTFDRAVRLHLNGESIEVVHFPRGHTDGDAVVFFPGSNVVHMGDLMFADRFPFVDLASGGSLVGYTEAVAAVLERIPDDAAVIPGHGQLTDVEGLRRFHDMLVTTAEIVRERMEEGASLEETTAAGLPERWSSWGEGFISTEQWLETIYRSLE